MLNQTLKASKETLDNSSDNGQIWIGPIQGGEHQELVKNSTKNLVKQGFSMLALGSPVEFMESYEYSITGVHDNSRQKRDAQCNSITPFWSRPSIDNTL